MVLSGQTVADVGEFALIRAITTNRAQPSTTLLGPGDDAGVVSAPDGRVVVTTDVLVEKVHFRLDWSPPDAVGGKAVAANLADIVAMGATPSALTVGIGCPGDTPAELVEKLVDGMWAEAERVGVGIVGGDLVQASELTISVTALGNLAGQHAVTRAGAQPDDVVAVCGRLGWARAGLAVLRRGFRSPVSVVQAYRTPEPDYETALRARSTATAMIDVSDGLLADLRHIAHNSHVSLDVHSHSLEIPHRITEVATALGGDALQWTLAGGEDYAFAATFRQSTPLPEGWRAIGTVASVDPDSAPEVTVDGKAFPLNGGWEHWSRN